ncbi:hypothetical protein HPB50_000091 [Hyalomma asiaticum]|uniref:Uncharacterized protein n=1 Tax=Hyalomma asiaticum TaxID=266040 RepID=A0ACB7RX09_HYAAI|nr:hypothetical protein HPB50_000091 [Hyalomma asiaticum]
MHLLLLLAIVLVVLVLLSVTVCLCYGLNSASCMAALKLNSAAHSVAGLYNGYADASSANDGSGTGVVVAPLERRNGGLAEQSRSYSSVIELYDSTWQVKEPPPSRQCRVTVSRLPSRIRRAAGATPAVVTLEKLDMGCSSASLLFPDAHDKNGAPPCSRFTSTAAVSLPSVLKSDSWNREDSRSPLTEIDAAERFRMEVRSCSLLDESSRCRQVSPVGS